MLFYQASEDTAVRRSESFWNMFRAEQEVFVELPGSPEPIRIPTYGETDAYWNRGPSAFESQERFEEVRAYMRHYFRDADSAPKYWQHRAAVEAAMSAALDAMSPSPETS